jgi:hypothetical protein
MSARNLVGNLFSKLVSWSFDDYLFFLFKLGMFIISAIYLFKFFVSHIPSN